MKLVLYIIGGFTVAAALLFLLTRGPVSENNPLVLLPLIALFGIPPVGAFWMMYQAARYEKSPLPLILLAMFLPFAFLWYYFERVRPGRQTRESDFA